MNTDAPLPTLEEAEAWVLEIQTKLHQWANEAPDRQFDDLYNLVYHPAVLMVAWHRVRGNRGARSAGVDGVAPRRIAPGWGLFLLQLHHELKSRTFRPLPVRQRMIPKPNGKLRGLGIPTARDRTVQAALKLILEPVFEADFQPCSYGFRPNRRAQDAITEIHFYATRCYEWVLEADIAACFDEISHPALMDRIRRRIKDKRVLTLVKAFLKAGILTEAGARRNTNTGAPQGGLCAAAHNPPCGVPRSRS
ncbi:MAG: reverse transcriptase domain-containing protein [Micromonosporaceae bacterium]